MSRLLLSTPSQSSILNTNLYGQVATIFGGYGVVGIGITNQLAKHGCIMIQPFRRSSTDARQIQLATQDPTNYHPVHTDFTKPAQLRAVIEPADHVVVCIGKHQPPNTILRWRDLKWGFDAVHRQLPVEIAKIAKEYGKETMVFISRIGADVNSESKILRALGRAELEIREVMPQAIIIRPSDVFSFQGNIFVDLFRNIARRMFWKSVPVYPEMMGRRSQPVFSGDVGVAVATALRNPEHWGKTFELGGRQEFTFREKIEFVAKQTGTQINLINMPYPIARLWGRVRSRFVYEEGFPEEFFVRMQYDAIPNKNRAPDVYGWEDLGIDKRQLILLEEIAPDALFNFTHDFDGKTPFSGVNVQDARFLH